MRLEDIERNKKLVVQIMGRRVVNGGAVGVVDNGTVEN